jgi:hypothetical protein
MNRNLAQAVFLIFTVSSIPIVFYPVYEHYNVLSAIKLGEREVYFDTGTYYLLLMSCFWLLYLIQVSGIYLEKTKGIKLQPGFECKGLTRSCYKVANLMVSKAGVLVVGWFLCTLLMAIVLPVVVSSTLNAAGYVACKDPREVSRVAKGKSLVYTKGQCE